MTRADDAGAPPWREEVEETAAFLEWLGTHNFIFLGYREYTLQRGATTDRLVPVPRSGLGLLRTDSALNAACGPDQPKAGRLALVSQSGALCTAMIDWARTRQVGFSTVISTGLGADIGLNEILDFLVHDAATDSIMLYVEGIQDARRFMSALRAAARVKPVVVMKSGRHAESAGAAAFRG